MKDILIGFGILLAVCLPIIFALLAPYYEAKQFNECTGGNASYMTAMFTQLRVDNCTK